MDPREDSLESTQLPQSFESLIGKEPYGGQLKDVIDIFMPLALALPRLRDDPNMMKETVKATSDSGITDVATSADVYMQSELKAKVTTNHPDWQFWGEEGDDRISDFDETKQYLFITDPIEGTNNFKAHKDGLWGSVVALVDISSREPVIGIVADPVNRRAYIGMKGSGAFIIDYAEDGSIALFSEMPKQPEANEFTYNNSPHFEPLFVEQIQRFFTLGIIQPDNPEADELDKSRKHMIIHSNGINTDFVDPESGALEAIRNRGTIYFKTSNEMAAVFVILGELGGKVTDGNGNLWSLGINTLLSAREPQDHEYLSNVFNGVLAG